MADKEKKCINCKQFGFYKLFDSEGECKHSTMTVHPLEDACDKFQPKQYDRETDKAVPISAKVVKQIMWERDQAMDQLKANGLRFGHKDDYGWILVSERLPEDYDIYEVTAFWHETWQTMLGVYRDGIWWCTPYNNTGSHLQRLNVKAWKPLSRPYKEEN